MRMDKGDWLGKSDGVVVVAEESGGGCAVVGGGGAEETREGRSDRHWFWGF